VSLQSLTNLGSVSFTDATIGSLTGTGTTTFSGAATLSGGISEGVVDIAGIASIGAISGGYTILGNHATVSTLTGGTITTATGKALTVNGGVFGGSLLGNGELNTIGVVNLVESAKLSSDLSYRVAAPSGSLTFATSREIGTLANEGSTTFANGGSIQFQSGTGTISVTAGSLRVGGGSGSLEVGSLASASYSNSGVALNSVTNSGSLTLAADSSVKQINSIGNLTHAGTLTIDGGGSIIKLSGDSSTSLVKSGTGTLTLGGAYLGSTLVKEGTLSLSTGAVLSGNVDVNGGRLLLSGTNQLVGNLTLTSGVVDLGGHAQLTVGTFSTSGGLLESSLEAVKLKANNLNITGGTQNVVTMLRGDGAQSFTGTVTMPQIGETGAKNVVELNGVGASVSSGTIFAPRVNLAGSSNLLVVSGGSAVSVKETAAITIGGTQNTLEFKQGFAPEQALTLVVGDATSSGGTLRVGGSGLVLGGSQRQILMGKGTVDGNVSLGSGATFAPGNSPGKFTITGSLSITPGASTDFEYTAEKQVAVGSGSLDQLVVGTLASLRGSVSAFAVGGSVGAGGVFQPSGTSRVNTIGTTAVPVVLYSSGSAPVHLPSVTSYVTVGGGTYQSTVVTAKLTAPATTNGGTVYLNVTRNAFASFASGNVSATGQLLDRALQVNNPAVSNLIDDLDIQSAAAGVQSRLAALDPGVYADLGNIGLDRLRDIQSGLANHIDMLALDSVGESSLSLAVKPGQSAVTTAVEQSRAWTTAYGGWGKRNSDAAVGSAGYSSNHFGDISGVETKVGGLTLGLLGAVGFSNANFENGRGKVTSDSWHTGVYGNFPAGALVLDASVAYGQSESTLKRSVNVLGGGSTTGKSQGTEWTGQVGVAVPFRSESGSLMLTPSLHLMHASVKQDGLTESSLNGLEAVVNGRTTSATSVRTGLQAAKITKLADKQTRLTASLDWIHSFDDSNSDVDIALSGAGTTTSRFQGSRSGKDAIRVGLGGEIALTERTRLRLNVDQQRRSGLNSTYGSASFSLQF
jgi:fibronectin-binding autotransporter adhesin